MLEYVVIAIGLIICLACIVWLISDLGGPCESVDNKELYRKG